MNAPTERPFAHRYRRRGWTPWELLLLVTSVVLIVSPLVAVGVALLLPQTIAAQAVGLGVARIATSSNANWSRSADIQKVDLRVSKIATSLIGADLTSIGPGQEFYYEIIVQTEATNALDVTLTDSFPAGVEPVAIRDQNGGDCSISGNQVNCALTTTSLRPATVLIQSRISASSTVGTQITNIAVATSGGTEARSSVAVLVAAATGTAPTTAAATTAPAAATATTAPAAPPTATTQASGATAVPATATRTALPTLTPAPVSPTIGTPLPTSTPLPPTATPMETAIVLQTSTPAPPTLTPLATATSAPATATPLPTATQEATEEPTPIEAQGSMATATTAPTDTPPTDTPAPPPTESVPQEPAPPANTPVPAPPASTPVPAPPAPPAPAATQRPAPPATERPAPSATSRPAAGAAQQPAPPAAPVAPDQLGQTLPATSSGWPHWLPVMLGLALLLHTVRVHRVRTRI